MMTSSHVIVSTLLLTLTTAGGRTDEMLQSEWASAKSIADDWLMRDESRSTIGHRVGSGPAESDEFYAYSVRFSESVSYEEAWFFYARKCGTDYEYRETFFIAGYDNDDGDRVTIIQRPSEGSRATTFSLHTATSTVVVHLVEARNEGGSTRVDMSLIVTRR